MRHAGDPVELDYSYYALDLVAGSDLAGKRRIKGGAPRVLAELGYPEREFTDRVSVRMPTTEEIEALDLPEVPVIRQFRTVLSDGGKPVAVNIMIKGGHRYDLVYRQAVEA
jgi:GntR family transcriptional regulator